jgi:hypothetical protein
LAGERTSRGRFGEADLVVCAFRLMNVRTESISFGTGARIGQVPRARDNGPLSTRCFRVHAVFMFVDRFFHARAIRSDHTGARATITATGVAALSNEFIAGAEGRIVSDGAARIHAGDVVFDFIDTASAQSFPASDPPAWAIGRECPATWREGVIDPASASREEVNDDRGKEQEEPGDRAALF